MGRACRSLDEVVADIIRIVDDDKAASRGAKDDAEYFFRGEKCNYLHRGSPVLDTNFDSFLDRFPQFWKHERELYQEAMRLNVASFTEDRTMAERLARMQHYQLPTRFADLSVNALLSAFFACGGCDSEVGKADADDGFIRVIKVAKHKMKSFTSDIIVAISHLPLVNAADIDLQTFNGLGHLTFEIKRERPCFYDESEDRDLGQKLRHNLQQVWAFKPLMNNPRIRNQGGLFLAFGCHDGKRPLNPTFSHADYDNKEAPSYGIEQVDFVRIAADAKSTIREQLRMFGMAEETVYPELSNVCKTLDKRFRERKEDG